MTSTITVHPAPAGATILGLGSYEPSRVVSNAEMCTMIDSSDEWIQQRTGIVERRWATEEETLLLMTVTAARRAIAAAGLTAADLDVVILASVTHLVQTPALAPTIAIELGCEDAAAYDIGAACAGFCYGLAQADSLIRAGNATHVLVIGAERLSDLTNFSDRSTAFLFADGAGAAVVGPSETPGIGPVVWGSDGTQAGVITQSTTWPAGVGAARMPVIEMDGRPVFRWATTFIAEAAQRALDAAGITADDLDLFVPHQANNRITDSMLRHLKLPERVVVSRHIKTTGNTSAASIPLALTDLIATGDAKSGDLALIIGFGAGLVYAGQVIRVP